MSTVYLPYVKPIINAGGVSYFIAAGEEVVVAERVYVRYGGTLHEDRDAWHETRSAAMDEAAVRIDGIARRLNDQAEKIRAEAVALREKAAAEVTT